MRLSITLGVGGRQGVTSRGVVGGMGVGCCLLRLVSGPAALLVRLPAGLLVESRLGLPVRSSFPLRAVDMVKIDLGH